MSGRLDLDINSKKKVYISNKAIIGKQPMSLREAKLLRVLIMQVGIDDKDFIEYEADIKDLAKYLGISSKSLYRDMQDVCKKLMGRILSIKTDNPKELWSYHHWISTARYDGNNKIYLKLDPEILPFVIDLQRLFTKFEMIDILSLDSMYALRIYEILKMEYTHQLKKKHVFEFTIDELREFTDTENKFKTAGSFKEKVLNIAEREINSKTDICIKIENIKQGRQVTGYSFQITEKDKIKHIKNVEPIIEKEDVFAQHIDENEAKKNENYLSDTEFIYQIMQDLNTTNFSCEIAQAEKIYNAYKKDREKLINNINIAKKKGNINNMAGYIWSVKDSTLEEEILLPKSEKKRKTRKESKIEKIETMSESRKQAYLDMEVKEMTDLWPDLELVDEKL